MPFPAAPPALSGCVAVGSLDLVRRVQPLAVGREPLSLLGQFPGELHRFSGYLLPRVRSRCAR